MSEPEPRGGLVSPRTRALGSTGLRQQGGILYEEFHRNLRGAKKIEVLKEMSSNDSTVSGILYLMESLVRQTERRVVESPIKSKQSDDAVRVLDEACDDMRTTWQDHMSEWMSSVVYGHSLFEVVYKQRLGEDPGAEDVDGKIVPLAPSKYDDGAWGWAGFEPRSQDTVDHWEFDKDSGICRGWWQTQQIWSGKHGLVYLPLEGALHYRFRPRKDGPEGTSLLRGAYRDWFLLRRKQELESIGIERDLVGLVVMEVPLEVLSENASADNITTRGTLSKLVQQIRRDEQEGVLIPTEKQDGQETGYKMRLLSGGGSRQFDIAESIRQNQQGIATAMLADFMLIGHDKTGSYALADSKTNTFTMALGTLLRSFYDTLNLQVVPQLMKVNGFPRDAWAWLDHGDVETPDMDAWGGFFERMVSARVLTPGPGLEGFARRVFRLPEMVESEIPHPDDYLGGAGTPGNPQVFEPSAKQRSILALVSELRAAHRDGAVGVIADVNRALERVLRAA